MRAKKLLRVTALPLLLPLLGGLTGYCALNSPQSPPATVAKPAPAPVDLLPPEVREQPLPELY